MTKDCLGYENERNKKNAALYTAILQKAWGQSTDVLIGHHLCTEQNHELKTENEIPSADTLIFDHEVMGKIFGGKSVAIMMSLAARPAETRDALLVDYFVAECGPFLKEGETIG